MDGDHAPETEAEILMSRIVDGEDDETDRRRFDDLAAAEPALWRRLALHHRDAGDLGAEVRRAIAPASAVELPRRWLLPGRMSWTTALSGWAAVIIVAASWLLATLNDPRAARTDVPTPAVVPLAPDPTYEEHFKAYLEAPYVLGEMQPVVLEVETFPDGGTAVRLLRRIEEIMYLDPDDAPPGEGTEAVPDPAAPRRDAGPAGMPN